MRNATAAVIASVLTLSTLTAYAGEIITDRDWQRLDGLSSRANMQNQMFEGVKLTEIQRQQMRDLMRLVRQDKLAVDVNEVEAMHRLVTADKFDERAVQALAEKIARAQVARQVELARVRNQMFHLLTPEQQTQLNARHEQRMQEFREISGLHRATSGQLLSSSNQ